MIDFGQTDKQSEIFLEVLAEREHQKERGFDALNDSHNTYDDWTYYIKFYAECYVDACEDAAKDTAHHRLIQVIALAFAAIEREDDV